MVQAIVSAIQRKKGKGDAQSQHLKEIDEKIDRLTRLQDEQYLSILRLTIMSTEMPMSERLIAGKKTVLDICGSALVAGGYNSEFTWHLQGTVHSGWYPANTSAGFTGYAYDSYVEMATMYLATSNGIYTSDDGYTWTSEYGAGHIPDEAALRPVYAFAKNPTGDFIAFAGGPYILQMNTSGSWDIASNYSFGVNTSDPEICAYIRATYFNGRWVLFNWSEQIVHWSSNLSASVWPYYNFSFETAPAIPFIDVSSKKLITGVSFKYDNTQVTQLAYSSRLGGLADMDESWNDTKDILTIDDGAGGTDVTDRIRKLITRE